MLPGMAQRRPIFPLLLALAGTLAIFPLTGAEEAAPFTAEELDSHRRMLEVMSQLREQTAATHPFLGTRELEMLRERLAGLSEETPPGDRFDTLMRLGIAELNHGLERDSIAHLESALAVIRDQSVAADFPRELVRDALHFLIIAKLRLAETENCCAANHPESCIYPISEAARHHRREGSEQAVSHLTQMLTGMPMDDADTARAIWLLNIAAMTLGNHPDGVPAPWLVPVPREPAPWLGGGEPGNPPPFPAFRNIAAEAGVNDFSLSGGAIADDFNGDGWIDLVTSSWDPAVSVKLHLNDGDGTFTEADAGLEGIGGGLNLTQADYDNDGHLDILVLRGAWLGKSGRHPNSLLRNDGRGRFIDVTHAVGLAEPARPTQTGEWADYDLDGDLDLFIGNESLEDGDARCQLFRNEGGKAFTDVAAAAGLDLRAFVKGASWGDYDGDHYPDLFLSCMGAPNRLFRNRGDGTFEDVSALLGPTAGPIRSFPAWFLDHDNDGWLDLFVSNYTSLPIDYVNYYRGGPPDASIVASLFHNQQGKGFRDIAREVGLDRPMLPMGSNFADLTNNGFPDFYLGSGTPDFDALVPNLLLIHDGKKYHDLTLTSRMGHLQKGHAVTFADFDGDGDLDLFEQMSGALPGDKFYDVLFENPGFGRAWLGVRLVGTRSNNRGVGCRVSVTLDEPGRGRRQVHQWMDSGGSFGANPLRLHFGLGEANRAERVEVHWPVTGKTQVLSDVDANQIITIHEEE